MAAPVVAFLVAFLTGATLARSGVAPTILAVDAAAARVTAIEEKVCPAADVAAAGLAAIPARGIIATIKARVARDAALVCADRAKINTPAVRLAAAAKLLADIAAADGLFAATPAEATATQMCGRQPCR